ncbi:hypothetical protein YM3MPS_23650 [Mycobacterium pseudoshottsii]|nr:hypothetical protein YM3MPS_23650 [Mycobacterium pseudoshottsii]
MGASSPFQFFSSHPEPELAVATAQGRKAEFAEHGWDADEIPDPQDPQTFLRSKLVWGEGDSGEHAQLLRFYRDLIALRHHETDLADPWLDHLVIDYDEQQSWIIMRRSRFGIACNLGTEATTVPLSGALVLGWGEPNTSDSGTELAGHSVAVLRCDQSTAPAEPA